MLLFSVWGWGRLRRPLHGPRLLLLVQSSSPAFPFKMPQLKFLPARQTPQIPFCGIPSNMISHGAANTCTAGIKPTVTASLATSFQLIRRIRTLNEEHYRQKWDPVAVDNSNARQRTWRRSSWYTSSFTSCSHTGFGRPQPDRGSNEDFGSEERS
ncbi:uncharacterized protein [Procambarus clarkii]|uniref:uncharacterized protein n=1 Tax=Procambarus clarkii TaxID=6728 RepID=UPI003742BF37